MIELRMNEIPQFAMSKTEEKMLWNQYYLEGIRNKIMNESVVCKCRIDYSNIT
jgi:hypothetical protein